MAATFAFLRLERSKASGGRASEVVIPKSDGLPATLVELVAPTDAREAVAVPPKESTPSRREFLSEYWGARWPEIEKAILSSRMNLDDPLEIVSWEEAAPELAESILMDEAERKAAVAHLVGWWNENWEDSYESWLRNNIRVPGGLAPDEVPALEDACRPFNDRLAELGELYADQINAHLRERWVAGRFIKAPLTTTGVTNEQGFYATAAGGGGWACSIVLKIEDCPDVAETARRADEIKSQRAQAGAAYLRSIRGR